ncbi:dihydropteroate synthase [Maribacter sp. 2210JD10-5]|uniref:dihydropteroate synthase n=1 Tax=Maribacter sp. 2210JD10-5 TaxID=3386272 RepID=UPI0039BCE0DA
MTINCKGQLINLAYPKIMGILNITPDSFYDGGKYKNESDILSQVEKMLTGGATFLDIGAYSSRPGADEVSEAQELKRIIPVVDLILKHFPTAMLSIDTFRSQVAKQCIALGAAMINDISGGKRDAKMIQTIAKCNVPYIMMHMRGNPKTMQQKTDYEDLAKDMLFYFSERLAVTKSHGIKDVIIDPGFGFSKNLEQNYTLLKNLNLFKITDCPLLVGISRKSMIYKLLGNTPSTALNGTTALHMFALDQGANILRVHDVKEARECVRLYEQLQA